MSKKKSFLMGVCAAALTVITGIASVDAAPITPGNLVVSRFGTGTAALAATATPVFLDEYTSLGVFVQTIAAPTTGSSAMTVVGTATSEGVLTLSQNGQYVTFAGYRKDVGGTNPSSDTAAVSNRVIGSLNLTTGLLDTSSAITSVATNTFRSVATVDGSTYYGTTANSVYYLGAPSASITPTLIDARNSRQIAIYDNIVYASNGAAIMPKVQSYGVLPTGATSPTTIMSFATTTQALNSFAFADLSPSVAGVDTVYGVDTAANLLWKYSFDGVNWVSNGSVAASGSQSIAISVVGTTVNVYGSASASIVAYTDISGYNTAPSGTFSPLAIPATPGTNYAFRGIAVAPAVPEPGTLSLLAIAGIGLLRRTKRD